MKKTLFLAVIALLLLTGCVEYGLTIKVNKDGSGQIVEEMLMANQIINMAKAMNTDEGNMDAFSKERVMEKGSRFGQDVTYKDFEEIKTEAKQGYRVTYSFNDINKVQLSDKVFSESVESVTENVKMGNDDEAEEESEDDEVELEKFYNFDYNKKGKLVIKNGFTEAINEAKEKKNKEVKEWSEESEKMSDEEVEQNINMAKMFVQGMKFFTRIEFDNIKDANVPYENNQITLFEIDMDKLLDNPDTFKELMKDGDTEITKFLNNEKQIDGIIFHYVEDITVDFK